jgi:hypothetical protein
MEENTSMRSLRLLPLLALLLPLAAPCPARAADADAPEPPDTGVIEVIGEDADRLSLHADYLYWWLRRLRTPPLLTAVLDDGQTAVLRGGDRITSRHDRYVGIRIGGDYWLDNDRTWAIEGNAFFLERDSTHFSVAPGAVPVLAIPFLTAPGMVPGMVPGAAGSYVVSGFNPAFGNLSGGTTVYSRMELFGQEANILVNLARGESGDGDLFAGGRFLQLRERLDLTSASRVLPQGSTVLGLEDHFQTFNKFYGGQVGARGRLRFGRLSLEGRAAVALGGDDEVIRNKGQRTFHTPQVLQEQPFGLFVLPGNRGNFSRMAFGVVSEARLDLAYALTRHANLRAGYSLLTWDGPVRPGDQVVPLPPRPNFKEDFFWAHGFNAGVELRW